MKKIWVLAALTLGGCATEAVVDGAAQQEVLISLSLPASDSSTRAMSDTGEQEVEDVDVFLFDPTTDKFVFRSMGNTFTSAPNVRTFMAKMLEGKWNILFVANARQQIIDNLSYLNQSTTRTDFLNRLTMQTSAEQAFAPSALPMFGLLPAQTVAKGQSLTVTMVRSVAKIDIRLASVIVAKDLQLADARLYNQPLRGWVGPDLSTWPANNSAVSPWFGGAAAPARAVYPTNQPVVYPATSGMDILNSIYLFETPWSSADDWQTNMCVVVGGYYQESDRMSYYRADINQQMLRNHVYTIRIDEVTGPGYDSPDEAFRGVPRMVISVQDWLTATDNVIFDRSWHLAVETNRVDLLENPTSPITVRAVTDYNISNRNLPKGIVQQPLLSSYAQWLSVTLSGKDGDLDRTYTIKAKSANTTLAAREAFFQIKAGNMIKMVQVVQAAVTKGPRAVYGVIGYVWQPGHANHRKLTILGDQSYYQNYLDGADELPQSRQGQDTVYVAYFRLGSLVASSSQRWYDNGITQTVEYNKGFSSDWIIEWPREWAKDRQALDAKFAGVTRGQPAADLVPLLRDVYPQAINGTVDYTEANFPAVPAQAIGDPCVYYFGADGWRTPTEQDWQTQFLGGAQELAAGADYQYVSPTLSNNVNDPGYSIFRLRPAGEKVLPRMGIGSPSYGIESVGAAARYQGYLMGTIRNGSLRRFFFDATKGTTIDDTGTLDMEYSFPVRCVK